MLVCAIQSKKNDQGIILIAVLIFMQILSLIGLLCNLLLEMQQSQHTWHKHKIACCLSKLYAT